jgi:hypothetical protein
MTNSHHQITQTSLNFWRFIPYAAFGILAFCFTSATGLPILLKSYLMILEIPLGLLAFYILLPKLIKNKKK